jgi:hypothetical protein
VFFLAPFRKAKFCDVPSGAIVKVGRVVDKRKLQNTELTDATVT